MEIIANLTSYSKDLICRICMQNSDNLFPIFHEVFLDDDTVTIADIITECTKYPVTHTDHLPAQICNPCIKAARCAYQFKKQTEEAFCHLKALYDVSWIPEEEEDNSVSVGVLCKDKCTQTERNTTFYCKSYPRKLLNKSELRKRITSHIYDKKICRVCGVKFTHLGKLKAHLSTEHSSGGTRCVFKCNTCPKVFTRKSTLERHLNKVHKAEDKKLIISEVSLDEIEIENSTEFVPVLNNHCSNWSDCQEEENNEPIAIENQNNDTITDTISFSNEDKELNNHNCNDMDEECVEQREETEADPEILIKVENYNCNSNVSTDKKENQNKCIIDNSIEKVNTNFFEIQAEKSDHNIDTGDDNDVNQISKECMDDDYDHDSNDNDNCEPTKRTTKTAICSSNKQKKSNAQNKNCTSSTPKTNNAVAKPVRKRRSPSKNKENRCKECNRTFTRYNYLRLHMWTHSEEKPHVCNFCGRGFSRSDRLRKHIQNIHSEKNYKCDQCSSAYVRKEDLLRHIDIIHNKDSLVQKQTFDCDMCDKKFSKKSYLLKHKPLHTDRPYACRHCSETFSEKEQMKEHMEKEHSITPNFLCNVCGTSFDRSDNLKMHIRRHTGEKPFKCRFCEKCFTRRTELKNHERYHIGFKPHLCNLCGKSFCHSRSLTMHIRTHTGEKPYKCNQCPKAFIQSNDLKAHMRRHTGERFCCNMCNAAFLQRYTLTTHLKKVHDVIVASIPRRVRKINQPIDGADKLDQQLPMSPPAPPKQIIQE